MVTHGGGTCGHYSLIHLLPDINLGVHMSTSGLYRGLHDIKELIFMYIGEFHLNNLRNNIHLCVELQFFLLELFRRFSFLQHIQIPVNIFTADLKLM